MARYLVGRLTNVVMDLKSHRVQIAAGSFPHTRSPLATSQLPDLLSDRGRPLRTISKSVALSCHTRIMTVFPALSAAPIFFELYQL